MSNLKYGVINATEHTPMGIPFGHELVSHDSTGTLYPEGIITGGGGGATNLSTTASPTNVIISSNTGTDATINPADTTNSGLMTPAQVTKLAGVQTGATANSTDASLLNRTNHTGTQSISTISGLQTAIDQKQNTLTAGTNVTIVGNVISATGGGGGASNALVYGGVISASRLFTASDLGKLYDVDTSAGAVALTLNSGVVDSADDLIGIRRLGGNSLTIVGGTAALSNPEGITIGNGSIAFVMGVTTNSAVLVGSDSYQAKTNVFQQWSKNQTLTPVAVTYTATIALDAIASDTHVIAPMTGSITMDNPINLVDGIKGRVIFRQDATGGRSVTFGGNKWATAGGSAVSVASGANDVTMILWQYIAAIDKCVITSTVSDISAIV